MTSNLAEDQRARAWADLPPETMAALMQSSRDQGWRKALAQTAAEAPSFVRRLNDLALGNWHLLTLPRRTGRSLDLGCGYGSLSLGLSEHYYQSVGLEPIAERVGFASLRARQDRRRNAAFVRGSGHQLPFGSGRFDLVALNGVLEWAAIFRPGNPGALQRELLRESARMLTDTGVVAVAIENRFALETLTGLRDTHTGVYGITALPRWAADRLMRWQKGQPYRTWLYSRRGYHRLLRSAGLADTRVLDLISSYNDYDFVVNPQDGASYRLLWARNLVRSFYRPADLVRRNLARVMPRLLGELSYAYLALGGRSAATVLDHSHRFWRAAAGWGVDAGRHRFAVRGEQPGELAVVTHNGERISGMVEFGPGVGQVSRTGILPGRLRRSLQAGLRPVGDGEYHGIPCRLHLPA